MKLSNLFNKGITNIFLYNNNNISDMDAAFIDLKTHIPLWY